MPIDRLCAVSISFQTDLTPINPYDSYRDL
jgi:hypothetical protein